MPPDVALLSALIGSNYPCLELIFMVPKVFEPLKFDCNICSYGKKFWGLKNKLEIAMVNEPSMFEPLKFQCIKVIILNYL